MAAPRGAATTPSFCSDHDMTQPQSHEIDAAITRVQEVLLRTDDAGTTLAGRCQLMLRSLHALTVSASWPDEDPHETCAELAARAVRYVEHRYDDAEDLRRRVFEQIRECYRHQRRRAHSYEDAWDGIAQIQSALDDLWKSTCANIPAQCQQRAIVLAACCLAFLVEVEEEKCQQK